MDAADLIRSLGRIEAKLEAIHGDVKSNTHDVDSLKAFRSRVKGAATFGGVIVGAVAGSLGFYLKLKDAFM